MVYQLLTVFEICASKIFKGQTPTNLNRKDLKNVLFFYFKLTIKVANYDVYMTWPGMIIPYSLSFRLS